MRSELCCQVLARPDTRQGFVKVVTWLAENDGMALDPPQAEPPSTASMQSQNLKQGTWSSTTMLSPSEIASLRQEAKESQVRIKAYLKQLREDKARRAIAASGNANKGNENGQQSSTAPDSRTGAHP